MFVPFMSINACNYVFANFDQAVTSKLKSFWERIFSSFKGVTFLIFCYSLKSKTLMKASTLDLTSDS